jgi:hypothetical protein
VKAIETKGLNKKRNRHKKDVPENPIHSRIRIRSLNLAVFTRLLELSSERGG